MNRIRGCNELFTHSEMERVLMEESIQKFGELQKTLLRLIAQRRASASR